MPARHDQGPLDAAHSMLPTDLLIGLIYVVMGLLLVLQQLMRLALVLIILAPLAPILWILPQTHGWGRVSGSLFVGTVFAQAVQVLGLRLGFNLATDIPPTTASGLMQPLLGIAVLFLTLKIPGLMRGGGGWRQSRRQSYRDRHRRDCRWWRQPPGIGALGAGRAASAARVGSAARPTVASQYSLPMSVGVPSGRGSSQLETMSSIAQRLSGEAGTSIPHEVEREQDRG
jgi:hypothetical protein